MDWLNGLLSLLGSSEFLWGLWGRLNWTYQIYLVVALVATLVLLIQMLLTMVGLGDLDALDAADAADSAEGVGGGFLGVRTITGFFGGFGWSGIVAMESGLSGPQSFLVSIPIGLLFLFTTYGILFLLKSLQTQGTLDYENAVGEVGEVYLPIPPNRSDTGKIRVTVQGRLRTVNAYNTSDQRLETHSRARVIDKIDDTTLLVEPLSSDQHSED